VAGGRVERRDAFEQHRVAARARRVSRSVARVPASRDPEPVAGRHPRRDESRMLAGEAHEPRNPRRASGSAIAAS
jgi:hypothetical protein